MYRPTVADGSAEPGIWGHAYEVNEGGPRFRPWSPFGGSGPARAAACENAQSADLGRRGDPVGAADDDESTRGGRSPRGPRRNCQNKANAGTLD